MCLAHWRYWYCPWFGIRTFGPREFGPRSFGPRRMSRILRAPDYFTIMFFLDNMGIPFDRIRKIYRRAAYWDIRNRRSNIPPVKCAPRSMHLSTPIHSSVTLSLHIPLCPEVNTSVCAPLLAIYSSLVGPPLFRTRWVFIYRLSDHLACAGNTAKPKPTPTPGSQ